MAMRITYLIGNGFDLGLGLRTSYRSFLKDHYLKIVNSEIEAADLLRDVIRKDLNSWGDAELAFAQINDKRFLPRFPGSFFDAYDDFRRELVKYLRRCEECLVDQVKEDVSCRFRQTLLSIFTGLRVPDRGKAVIGGNSAIELSFLNFNYTRSLSLLLGKQRETVLDVDGLKRRVVIHDPIHVHEVLASKNVVFGVCDKDDIKGFGGRELDMEYLYQLLLKRENEKVGVKGHAVLRAWETLAKSDIIVIFGMSLGVSDSYWWNGIGALLKRKSNPRVVYSPHFTVDECTGNFETLLRNEHERIVKNLHLDANDQNVRNRVLILGVGPHLDFDGDTEFCDPLHLTWFSRRVLNDASQSTNQEMEWRK